MVVPVSAVVVAYNEEKYIASCLESILGQTHPVEEVLLVDDLSTDRTVEIAEAYPVDIWQTEPGDEELHNIYLLKRAGICLARNDVVLSVDGDTVLASDFLERGLKHLEEGFAVATGSVHAYDPTPMGDLVALVCNVLPKNVYYSGPGYVIDRRRYYETCQVRRNNGLVDICVEEPEIPLHKMNLVKDPKMLMYTELPSTGQKRMLAGAKATGLLLTALKVVGKLWH